MDSIYIYITGQRHETYEDLHFHVLAIVRSLKIVSQFKKRKKSAITSPLRKFVFSILKR